MVVVADAYARTHDAYAVASLIPAGVDELVRMAAAIEAAGVRWLEVNLGAAHGEEAAPGAIELVAAPERVAEIVGRVRATVALPLTVKLPGHGDVIELAAAARVAGADSVCLAGRTLGFLPDLETRRPVLGTFGAIGGAWALPLTLRWVAKARQRLGPDFPFLATNGIRDGRDAARALLAGASAVELATAVWIEGFDTLTRAIGQLAAYLEEQGSDAADIVGESADAVMTLRGGSSSEEGHVSSTSTYGATVTVEALESDPYPIYERLRDEEPVSWVESVGLWLVTRWDDVVHVDKTPDLFTGETEPSTLNRTFGKNLLGSEGDYHGRIRSIIYPGVPSRRDRPLPGRGDRAARERADRHLRRPGRGRPRLRVR